MKIFASDTIPKPFRRKGVWVIATIFMRGLLNFLGLAMLLPVLVFILDPESIHGNRILNSLYEAGGFESTGWFVAAVCAAVVIFIAAKSLLGLWLYRTERDYIYDMYRYLSRRLYINYHNRGLPFIKSRNSAVLSRNVNVVSLTFVAGVLRPMAVIFSEATLFMLLFVALAFYNVVAAVLIVVIFLPAVWLYVRMVRNRLNSYGEAENRAQRAKTRSVIDTYRGYADIEICNAFPQMLARFDKAMDEVVEVRSKNATLSMLPQMFTETGLAVGLSLMVLANLGIEGNQIKILFGVFAVAALRLMPSIRNIMGSWASLRYNRYTIPIIRDEHIDDIDTSVDSSSERFDFRHEIRLDSLSFRFADGDRDVIHDLSLTIAKGERLGIRGRSGAGKTTLFNLMLGFYEPTSGVICVDGEPLTGANRRKWQNTIGYVSQNVFIADGTFVENIALGADPDTVDRKRLDRAIDMANLREFIDSLPLGVDTPAGECGNRLSGGQRQRIGIARALYKEADVLFFDEATSSLDNSTEQNINAAIEELSRSNKELTIIVIAHRESSLDYCDRTITLDQHE